MIEIKLMTILKKKSSLEQSEILFEKERVHCQPIFLSKQCYISFQNTSKRKLRKEQTIFSTMTKRLKFPDTKSSFPSGGVC